MLDKPDLRDERIISCLRDKYGLYAVQVVFLPLGADPNTFVYRVLTENETPYFLKLRRGVFDETTVAVPKFLSDQGIVQIISPIATRAGQLWAGLDAFNVILYPFIEGRNGFDADLSDAHWVDFGIALKGIHRVVLPPALMQRIPQETYSPQWRNIVKIFLERIEEHTFDEPVAAKLAVLLKANSEKIHDLVERAERLSLILRTRSPESVLCHSDIHAGNILIGVNDDLYLVDWDDPIFAPKERDLMFVGGGVGGVWHKAAEEALFYQGYGQTEIDPVVLAYYRYERIVQDIAVTCEQIFLTAEGGEDREEGLRHLENQFLPNNVVEIAYKSDIIDF